MKKPLHKQPSLAIMINYFLFISLLTNFPWWGGTLFQGTSPELREIVNLNTGWQYLDKDVSFSDLGVLPLFWETIDLPHTWNTFDATDEVPGYRRAASWYRKSLTLPDYDSQKAYLLYFEGVNLVAEVYVNNKHVGTHIGGYVGFEMDISAFLSKGPNLLGIRVDNSVNRDIIPSQKSDFFIHGGIVRDLWLKVLPKNHIKLVHVKTPKVSEHQAETIVEASFPKDLHGAWELEVRINAPDGKVRWWKSKHFQSLDLAQSVQVEMPVVSNPKLWSPDHPHIIEAEAIDETGQRYLQYNRRICFSHSDMGRLLTAYGTPTGSSIIEMANCYAAIEFEPAGAG